MDNRNVLKDLLVRLAEAEQLVKIGIEKNRLSPIERDILLEKLRSSYDLILFEKFQEEPTMPKQQVIAEKPKVEAKVIETVKQPEKLPEPIQPEITPIVIEVPVEQVITTDSLPFEVEEEVKTPAPPFEKPKVKEKPEEQKVVEPSKTVERSASHTVGEKFQGTQKFRNETLANNKKDVASVLQNKPIGDLTKAIGINDKFLFTKELFNGNAELYSKTIKQLNEFSDINDAIIFIQENFSWDEKNEAANQLIDLVRRKLLIG
jgi:hypothetical protein